MRISKLDPYFWRSGPFCHSFNAWPMLVRQEQSRSRYLGERQFNLRDHRKEINH